MDNHHYLIFGGSTKCGTTSVFKYFEFHPDVCACRMKESRYFLGDSYSLHAAKRDHHKYNNFGELFKHCKDENVRLEATPDYLYSGLARNKIKHELPKCKLVFILRDPIERLISWYKFASLNGLIDIAVSIDDFIGSQNEVADENAPQHLRSLEQGKYFSYLKSYADEFGSENILICFYEDLQADSENFCKTISRLAGISESYFDNFNFIVYNKSVPVKSVGMHQWFRKLKRSIRPVTRMLPSAMHKKLKLAGHKAEQAYIKVNENTETNPVKMSEQLTKKLKNYYLDDVNNINHMTGNKVPWKNFTTA